MKKLLLMSVVCLLAIPAMAFYEEGQKVTLTLWDGSDEFTTQEVEVTCGAVVKNDGHFPYQNCDSADGLTRVFIEEKGNFRDYSAYKTEANLLKYDKEAFEQELDTKPISMTRDCNNGNAIDFVHIAKGQVKKDTDVNPGFVRETLDRIIDGKGRISIVRYYNPEDPNIPDNEKEYLKARMNDFVMLDVRRFQKDTDLRRLCEWPFPVK